MTDSSNINRKTTAPDVPGEMVVTAKRLPKSKDIAAIPNILNNYRSYTYNFTIAVVKSADVGNPSAYMKSNLDFVILKSGGKGVGAILSSSAGEISRNTTEVIASEEGDVVSTKKEVIQSAEVSKKIVDDFNEKSPGRFDMFIENVELNNIMSPNPVGGLTTTRSVNFDVIEPYSINGFLEALRVGSIAAGYPNHISACFVLKMEFVGYPDNADITSASVVPKSTRYFLFRFRDLSVDISERGTKYSCKAFSWGDYALGQPNILTAPIQMRGTTVKDILEDLCEAVTEQISIDQDKSKTGKFKSKTDRYFIKFPDRVSGVLDFNKVNEIGKSVLADIRKDNRLFSFDNPQTTNKTNNYRITESAGSEKPNSVDSLSQVQYQKGANIHEIISSVVRDSGYIKNKLKNLNADDVLDDYGMLDYFFLDIKVENRNEIDPVSRKPYQDFTYIVVPYKIHATRVPGYEDQKIDVTDYKKIVHKEYDYIYTGKNVDVLNFKLNLNFLYFEQIPRAMGNTDQPMSKNTESNPDTTSKERVRETPSDLKKVAETNDAGISPQRVDIATSNVVQDGGNAGQPQADPYLALSRNLHNAVINNRSNARGELEILGDPFFLIQSGNSNYYPSQELVGLSNDGAADALYGQVMIRINFRNPYDISPFNQGSSMKFNTNLDPFSGIYWVTEVRSTFTDGVFKQKLKLIRQLGQVQNSAQTTDIAGKFISDEGNTDSQASNGGGNNGN
jgi:hypothetical protein